jgi:YD repeat-containing protein
MSTRTSLTVLEQADHPEEGPATKTLENMDPTNGNKVVNDGHTRAQVRNSVASSRTITYTYDERGRVTTKVVTLAANEECLLGPWPTAALNRHAGDVEDGTHVWLTASGSAGDVKIRCVREPPGLAGR